MDGTTQENNKNNDKKKYDKEQENRNYEKNSFGYFN